MKRKTMSILAAVLLCLGVSAGENTSPDELIRQTVDDVAANLAERYSLEGLQSLTDRKVAAVLTDEQRRILSETYLRFTVNVPVTVTVMHDPRGFPFWLEHQGFRKLDERARIKTRQADLWEKDYPAGEIGLGIDSFAIDYHYVPIIRPQDPDAQLVVSEITPDHLDSGVVDIGQPTIVNVPIPITELPERLRGYPYIRGDNHRQDLSRLLDTFRQTPYPATKRPDQVLLTWEDDPSTTQAIQWRTSADVGPAAVRYVKKSEFVRFSPGPPTEIPATTTRIQMTSLVNDPVCSRHTAVLHNLEPDTSYLYSVGHPENGEWSELREFSTAPSSERAFSFIYMGDVQNGFERWGSLLHGAHRRRPDAAFYIVTGDLVHTGQYRNEWDVWFEESQEVFSGKPLLPAIGNHEFRGGHSRRYEELFALPDSSPLGEGAYALRYSNALLIALNSNLHPDTQADWLESTLENSNATWKFRILSPSGLLGQSISRQPRDSRDLGTHS